MRNSYIKSYLENTSKNHFLIRIKTVKHHEKPIYIHHQYQQKSR